MRSSGRVLSVRTSITRLFRAALAGSLLSGGLLAASALSGPLPAGATTTIKLFVATTGTGTACTKASPCPSIADAAAAAGSDAGKSVVIKVNAGTYDENDSIGAGSLKSLSIEGAGTSSTIVDGDNNGTVVTLTAGTILLSGLTIENGGSDETNNGGGISNAATLTVSNVVFSSDVADEGGGIFNQGSLTLDDSNFNNDNAESAGGGVWSSGQLTADNVQLAGSAGSPGGGALFNSSSTATIENSTVSGTAPYNAGAILNAGTLNIENSTVTNSSAKGGGAIVNGGSLTISSSTLSDNGGIQGGAISSSGTLVINDSTLTGNSAQVGAAIEAGSVVLNEDTISGNTGVIREPGGSIGGVIDANAVNMIGTTVSDNTGPQIEVGSGGTFGTAASIIADPTSGGGSDSDCESSATASDLGYNLTDDATCDLTAATDVHGDPQLGTLGSNGGPTWTAVPELGSPATGVIPIGASAGSTQLCARIDQRAIPSTGNCTIGAVEGGFRIETASLPDATQGNHYPSTQLAVQDEGTSTSPNTTTLKWKALSLPSWLTLGSSGLLSGTTPKTAPIGTYSIAVKVTETVKTVSGGETTKTKTTVTAAISLTVSA
jgi:hypothetical protein